MATDRGRSPIPSNHIPRLAQHSLKNSTKYKFRVQSAPPLSLQQFLRSATGVVGASKDWQISGKYRPPPFPSYLSPEVRKIKKTVEPVWNPPGKRREKPPTSLSPEKIIPKHIPEPVWNPPGKYREKPPTSLSPEKIIAKHTPEPVWRPAGKIIHENVPFFDPPSLRWSLQDLLRSMPEMRPKILHTSRSMSTIRRRRKEEVEET